uniref:NADH dehydrogenase subunit 4 n=1 Tax=Pseudopotamilla reniformis TaxID=279639 RepID=UPI001FAF9CBB|nr:NADH dehydrogenase subunit 4 [Pseudopotamilla reniformis]ULD67139.1 NADH dehydrogenase subunit 4 [Pseudopotamilla reniformis]
MMKIIMPLLVLAPIIFKPRTWPLLGSILFSLTLISLFMFPIFHLSSSSHKFYIDSLSAPLISLTLWITSLMILASQKINTQTQSPQKFMLVLLTLLVFLLITFSMNNLITFYLFFEASLIPTFLLILGWGYQPERLQASMYLLLYTITASLPLLMMILLLASWGKSTFMHLPYMAPSFSNPLMMAWWILMTLAFMVKMPMYSLHLWLPKAHVEAPVAGSMILAAILLKLGSYALIRVSFLFPAMNQLVKFILIPIAMIGAIFTSLICLRQTDLKALIAYSSVGHMGLLIAGTLTNQQWGWQGSLTIMISHGLTSSALFSMANSIYETTQTRSLFLTKGLLALFPPISLMFFILAASNMAAPPSINLLGEIALIAPTLATTNLMILPLLALTFLGGAYSLHMYTSTNHGQPSLFSSPSTLLTARNLMIPTFHAAPSILLILKIDSMNPWL